MGGGKFFCKKIQADSIWGGEGKYYLPGFLGDGRLVYGGCFPDGEVADGLRWSTNVDSQVTS